MAWGCEASQAKMTKSSVLGVKPSPTRWPTTPAHPLKGRQGLWVYVGHTSCAQGTFCGAGNPSEVDNYLHVCPVLSSLEL